MSQQEAAMLIELGKYYHLTVWRNGTDDKKQRGELLEALNKAFAETKITFHAMPFQSYEHLVKVVGVGYKYSEIVERAARRDDGGIEWAAAFSAWHNTDGANGLQDLPAEMQALAVISHFSESARGYYGDITTRLYPWIDSIAQARSATDASALWRAINTHFPPSLTYAQDGKSDWTPQTDGKLMEGD